jgi:hypothetical protein
MRAFGTILIIGAALFVYGVPRPSPVPAIKTPLVDLAPPTVKPAEPINAPASRSEPKPQPMRSARPLNIVPPVQGEQTTRAAPVNQAGAPNPSPPPSNTKRTAEILTAAAIAALIVAESRRAYHAGGRPCACPDDTMRNGRACGARSAYSRPGGRSPLCYPTDVTELMISHYRARFAQR